MKPASFAAPTISLCCLLLGGLAGCGSGVPKLQLAKVSGIVLYKGEPVEGATVSFWAEKAPRAASGVTNAKGEFSLSMIDLNDGAMPGENKITVNKSPPGAATEAAPPQAALDDPTAVASMMSKTGAAGAAPEKPPLPVKYSKVTSTPLKETVAATGTNKFILQLAD